MLHPVDGGLSRTTCGIEALWRPACRRNPRCRRRHHHHCRRLCAVGNEGAPPAPWVVRVPDTLNAVPQAICPTPLRVCGVVPAALPARLPRSPTSSTCVAVGHGLGIIYRFSEPTSSTRAASVPARGILQAVPISLGPAGPGLMQAIASLGRQLVDGHRGPVNLTGFNVVVQASTGIKGDRPKNIIIDCHSDKRTVQEKDLIMAEWQQQQPVASNAGVASERKSPIPPPMNDVAAVIDTPGGNGESGSDSVDKVVYPKVTIHTPKQVLALPSVKKGVKTLSLKDFGAVVASCKLRTYKQMTYNPVRGIFKKAQGVIIGRGTRKGDFAWSRVTPMDVLVNEWTVEGSSLTVGGGCFIPPDSGNGGQRGGVEKKRIALCIAAHLCPFWSAILRGYFAENPVNRVALAKRFRRDDDAFANASGRRGRRAKLRKLSRAAKSNGEGVGAGTGTTHAPSDDDYDVDNRLDHSELPVTAAWISELSETTALYSRGDLLLLDASPTLPSSTVVSALSLPAAEFEAVLQSEAKMHVVLPRELIKRAFSLLASVDESSGALAPEGVLVPSSAGDASASRAAPVAAPAVSISVGDHPIMRCTSSSLTHMSSVLSLNEHVKQGKAFHAWTEALAESKADFPWELEFFVGSRLPVSAAANQVWTTCAPRRVGDPAWRFFSRNAGALGEKAGSDMYGGCTVTFSDIIVGGQRAYMTNAILDAALVEMGHHGALRLMQGYDLLTSQSAAFTTCHNKRVSDDDALGKIEEVYDVMPPARFERFLMMLNLMGHHWISSEVQTNGIIRIFDSSAGGFREEKDFAVARVLLFAREVGRLRRLGNPWAPVIDKWEVEYVDAPVQDDGYNCGPFVLAHLWCAANGLKLQGMNNVVGDLLRLAILCSVLECGKLYDEARLPAMTSD